MPSAADLHRPVLLEEALRYWVTIPDGLYLDLTLGMGGHAHGLLSRYPQARCIGFDWDPLSQSLARERLAVFAERMEFVQSNFSRVAEVLAAKGIRKVDGILFDLGPSTYQILHRGIGLTFQNDEPLDMRIAGAVGPDARALLRAYDESSLAALFVDYGGIYSAQARRLAKAIITRRQMRPLLTTADLRAALLHVSSDRKFWAQAFQSLRVAVNREIENLDALLDVLPSLLVAGGHAVSITFHSLEDRAVKRAFLRESKEGIIEILTKKALQPTYAQVKDNPKARSAKLRAISRC
ncbi:MAG: 16S rRNA (cytosine(1402)-N(4))-methyltransferase RsmH [Elusimicrobiota bacterium]